MAYSNVNHLRVEVERILLTQWDPVGVKGEPMAECEYGTYACAIASMLEHGSSEEAVADYLGRVEAERLGVGPDSDRCHRAAHECTQLLA